MLMQAPPGFNTTSVNQQNNQLLAKPGNYGAGGPAPTFNSTNGGVPGLSQNPLGDTNQMQAQWQSMLNALRGQP